MARFRFRLDALLGLREAAETRARRRLDEIRQRYRGKEIEIEELTRAREGAKTRCRQGSVADGDAADAADVRVELLDRRYITSLHRRLVEKGEELQRIGVELAQLRGEFAEARARKKVVEKLKSRRREAFEQVQARRERRDADEIGQTTTGLLWSSFAVCKGAETTQERGRAHDGLISDGPGHDQGPYVKSQKRERPLFPAGHDPLRIAKIAKVELRRPFTK